MNTNSQLSIIVPAYNSAKTLEKCLKSVYANRIASEVVVVDDGSQDSTSLIAKKFNTKLIQLDKNYGSGYARNKGQSIVTGDILVFIDSDIQIKENTLQKIQTTFKKEKNIDAITGILSIKHPNKNFASIYKNSYMNYIFSKQPDSIKYLYGSICAIKKDSLLPWCERTKRGVDTELGMRLTENNKIIKLCHEIEVIHYKKYTIPSLVRNDYAVPLYWTRLLLSKRKRIKLKKQQAFAHSSWGQISALLLTALIPALFILQAQAAAYLSILLWFTININFLFHQTKSLSWQYFLPVVIFSYIDQLIMLSGIVSGLICWKIPFTNKYLLYNEKP